MFRSGGTATTGTAADGMIQCHCRRRPRRCHHRPTAKLPHGDHYGRTGRRPHNHAQGAPLRLNDTEERKWPRSRGHFVCVERTVITKRATHVEARKPKGQSDLAWRTRDFSRVSNLIQTPSVDRRIFLMGRLACFEMWPYLPVFVPLCTVALASALCIGVAS